MDRRADLEQRIITTGIDTGTASTMGPQAHSALNSLNARVRVARAWPASSEVRTAVALTVVTAVVTVSLAAVPDLRFAYRGPGVRAAIETLVVLVSLFAAIVVYGRARLAASATNVLLLVALTIISFGTFMGAALPAALDSGGFRHVSTWGPLLTSTTAGVVLAAAALLSPRRELVIPLPWLVPGILACLGLGALALTLAPLPSTGIPPGFTPATSQHPTLTGSFPLLFLDAASIAAHFLAALAFLARSRRHGDRFAGYLGNACLLVAAARVDYFLFPSLDLQWFYVGDVWRVAAYSLVLWAVASELQGYWRRLREAAVLEERRRLARDLHDGLAQELALLSAEGDPRTAAIAQRALDEARRAIAALTRPLDEPFSLTLRRETEELAQRLGTSVSCRVEVEPEPDAFTREMLLRIAREAITNAARHGGAARVTVDLRRDGDLALSLDVLDDGCGISENRQGGFGITSMRERAAALGGTFAIAPAPGRGTAVNVRIPCPAS